MSDLTVASSCAILMRSPSRKVTSAVYCAVDATEIDPYSALGFDVHRREGIYSVPTRSVRIGRPPQGIVFAHADEVDEKSLRLLDDELRQDVPGTQGGSGTKPRS
jgi:hypothetical protein